VDRMLARVALLGLCGCGVLCCAALAVAALDGRDPPPSLVALASAALGALATYLAAVGAGPPPTPPAPPGH
jgi:hypothetical protein